MVLKAKTANRIIFDTRGYVTAALINITPVPDHYSQFVKLRSQFEFETMGTLRPIRQIFWTDTSFGKKIGLVDICIQLNVISKKDLQDMITKGRLIRFHKLLDELIGTTVKYKLRQKRPGNRLAAIDPHSLVRV